MDPQTLLEMVTALEPRILQALRSITVEMGANLKATARLNVALHTRAEQDSGVESVTLTAIEKWPDILRPVSTATSIASQIEALEESGIVGGIDAVRIQGNGEIRWRIRTHAGSEAEYTAWLRSL